MPLVFHDGQKFATGSVPYSYRPETEHRDIPKLFLQVQIEGQDIRSTCRYRSAVLHLPA